MHPGAVEAAQAARVVVLGLDLLRRDPTGPQVLDGAPLVEVLVVGEPRHRPCALTQLADQPVPAPEQRARGDDLFVDPGFGADRAPAAESERRPPRPR